MAVSVTWDDWRDASRTVDALLLAAEVERIRNPLLANRYRRMADDLGDALDDLDRAPARTRAGASAS